MVRALIVGVVVGAFVLVTSMSPAAGQTYYNSTGPQPTATADGQASASGSPVAGGSVSTDPDAATTTAAPGLPTTGPESEVLAYVGSAMITVGAIVLVTHRRMSRG